MRSCHRMKRALPSRLLPCKCSSLKYLDIARRALSSSSGVTPMCSPLHQASPPCAHLFIRRHPHVLTSSSGVTPMCSPLHQASPPCAHLFIRRHPHVLTSSSGVTPMCSPLHQASPPCAHLFIRRHPHVLTSSSGVTPMCSPLHKASPPCAHLFIRRHPHVFTSSIPDISAHGKISPAFPLYVHSGSDQILEWHRLRPRKRATVSVLYTMQ